MAKVNGLLPLDKPQLKHFAIATADNWIEVLCCEAPVITLIDSAK